MDYEENSLKDIEAGQRVQERIQFYFLTLAFTLLALAIETYEQGTNRTSSLIEICSWVLLLISGTLGLYRMHLIPKYFKLAVHKNMLRANIADAQEAKRKGIKQVYSSTKGKWFDTGTYIEEHLKGIDHFQGQETELTKHLKPIIWAHQSGLIAGIVLLAVARAYDTIQYVF
jgi:hypothetical protein